MANLPQSATQLARAAIERQAQEAQMLEFIETKERLPDRPEIGKQSAIVLCYIEYQQSFVVGCFDYQFSEWFTDRGRYAQKLVTRWALLPTMEQ